MFQLIFTHSGQKNLDQLDKRYRSAIDKALKRLKSNPEIGEPLKGQFKGLWRLRFSRYRIIYQIRRQELIIIVINIFHRRQVYR